MEKPDPELDEIARSEKYQLKPAFVDAAEEEKNCKVEGGLQQRNSIKKGTADSRWGGFSNRTEMGIWVTPKRASRKVE